MTIATAHYKDLDPFVVEQPRVNALEELVEEGQAKVVPFHVGCVAELHVFLPCLAGCHRAVGRGAGKEELRRALELQQVQIVDNGAANEEVVPAEHEEHGDIGELVVKPLIVKAVLLPVIIEVLVLRPVGVPLLSHGDAFKHLDMFEEGLLEPLVDLLRIPRQLGIQGWVRPSPDIVAGVRQAVDDVMCQTVGTVAACRIEVVAGMAIGGEHRLQVGRVLPSDAHLSGGVIGVAAGAHLAIGPGLLGDPLHRVVAVAALVDKEIELSLRGAVSPNVLKDEHVALLGEELGVVARYRAGYFVVGGPV